MPTLAAEIDGRQLSLIWVIPFVATLLVIALGPLLAARFWHSHYGKVVGLLAISFLVPFAFIYGLETALTGIVHVVLTEYLPFIILLTALFTAAGGICVHGNLHGRPTLNVGILALGTLLSSVMGTTGAAMLLVRPLIRANDNRKHVTHILVFFIFLVANIGGALTPLGDPPLFLGFLQGVDFFWPMKKIWPHTLLLVGALLAIFYVLDLYYFHQREEERPAFMDPSPDSMIWWVEGKRNFFILSAMIALVLLSGLWKSNVQWILLGTPVALHNVVRDIGLIILTILSVKITPSSARLGNQFSWEPMIEVAKLFAGIFLTIVPVIAILRAGAQGGFSPLLAIIYDEHGTANTAMFFWVTGLLSAFLDNAPTYLVFFNLAGGDAKLLMTQASVLISISAAAVFMGALTYVGNAPNLMVRAIAVHRGIKMPGFFGYMLWSMPILLPLFILLTYLFF